MTYSYKRVKTINLYLCLKAIVLVLAIFLASSLLFTRISDITKFADPTISQHLQAYNPNYPSDYSFHPDPSKRGLPEFRNPDMHTMAKYIYNLLKEKKNGFFVESGAHDGLWISNTVWLEREHNWTGLLVEVDPKENVVLKKRNRRAWVADVCLSTERYPISMNFTLLPRRHQSVNNKVRFAGQHVAQKQPVFIHEAKCYPMHMLLDAIGVQVVDYWSLEIEGLDLAVLKTVPWHRFTIKVISVESSTEQASRSIGIYLEGLGYKNITRLISRPEYLRADVYELKTQ